MTAFTEQQRAELRDAMARSRLAAQQESQKKAAAAKAPAVEVEERRDDMDALLRLPQAQEIIRRIGEATDPDYPNRAEHVAHVAAVVVRAKMCPNNAYAKATLT